MIWRARRLSVSSRGASPKPPRPRAWSFLTTKRMDRSKNSRATFMTSAAISLASPGCRRSRSRRLQELERPDRVLGGRAGGAPESRGRFPLRGGGIRRREATSASRGRTSDTSLAAKAERSASNWRGFSLLSVGLKTKAWMPICRARRRSDWLRLSVIIRTGGRRFIFQSRLTTSKPPWKEAPPEEGIPRSVTRTKGTPSVLRRPASLAAAPGRPLPRCDTRRRRSGRGGSPARRPRRPRGGGHAPRARRRPRLRALRASGQAGAGAGGSAAGGAGGAAGTAGGSGTGGAGGAAGAAGAGGTTGAGGRGGGAGGGGDAPGAIVSSGPVSLLGSVDGAGAAGVSGFTGAETSMVVVGSAAVAGAPGRAGSASA